MYEIDTDIPITDRDLIQRAIVLAKPESNERDLPRWVLVKRLFGTGQTISRLICYKFGFDPEEEISSPYIGEIDNFEEYWQ